MEAYWQRDAVLISAKETAEEKGGKAREAYCQRFCQRDTAKEMLSFQQMAATLGSSYDPEHLGLR